MTLDVQTYALGRSLAFSVFFAGAWLGTACSGGGGDPPNIGLPAAPLGQGARIRTVIDPESPAKAPKDTVVSISAASVVYVDTYDETGDGKSRGAVYVEDLDVTQLPSEKRGFSGVSLFAPTFVPSDLKLAPGDVLDFSGIYSETLAIGGAKFKDGEPLIQLSRPVGSFRYEASPVPATVIDANDLLSYKTGRKWVGMLVTVNDVTLEADPFANKGRLTSVIAGATDSRDSPVLSNELTALDAAILARGTRFKSITGVCTYFFNLKIAPRNSGDLVVAP
jgi:hypothetical protein